VDLSTFKIAHPEQARWQRHENAYIKVLKVLLEGTIHFARLSFHYTNAYVSVLIRKKDHLDGNGFFLSS
jgi:hypothetical protein